MVIHYENYITIGDKDLFEAVFSSYINNQGTLTELETTYTYDELKNKYTFSFQITEAGEYSLEFMFNNYIVNIAKVIVA